MELRQLLSPLLAAVLLTVPGNPSAGGAGADEAPPPRPATGEESAYRKDILPFLKAHCFACHGNGKAKAELSFDKFTDDTSVLADIVEVHVANRDLRSVNVLTPPRPTGLREEAAGGAEPDR